MERNFDLAPYYRRAVEPAEIGLEENACATSTARLRAAAFGVPFQPGGGLQGSDIPELDGWAAIEDPYGSGQSVWVIPAFRPDYVVRDCRKFGGQAAIAIGGHRSLAGWNRCPKPEPSVPL